MSTTKHRTAGQTPFLSRFAAATVGIGLLCIASSANAQDPTTRGNAQKTDAPESRAERFTEKRNVAPDSEGPAPGQPPKVGEKALPNRKGADQPRRGSASEDDVVERNRDLGVTTVKKAENDTYTGKITGVNSEKALISVEVTNAGEKAGNKLVTRILGDTEIQLNGEPAKLDELHVNDSARVVTAVGNPEVAKKIVAARVDPHAKAAPKSTSNRSQSGNGKNAPRSDFQDNGGGLGVSLWDSPGAGVLIVNLTKDAPAEKAHLRVGDYVMAFGEHNVDTPEELIVFIRDKEPGTRVQLTVWRPKDNLRQGVVELTSASVADDQIAEEPRLSLMAAFPKDQPRDELWQGSGVRFASVEEGLRVEAVEDDSVGRRVGLRRGDIVFTAAGRRVSDVAVLRSLATASDAIELGILRGTQRLTGQIPVSSQMRMQATANNGNAGSFGTPLLNRTGPDGPVQGGINRTGPDGPVQGGINRTGPNGPVRGGINRTGPNSPVRGRDGNSNRSVRGGDDRNQAPGSNGRRGGGTGTTDRDGGNRDNGGGSEGRRGSQGGGAGTPSNPIPARPLSPEGSPQKSGSQ